MEPVRIKYYGLFRLTQRTYLTLQFIALLICVSLMVVGFSAIHRTGSVRPRLPKPDVEGDILWQGMIAMFWLGLVGLVAEGLETIVMLLKFRRARAEQRAKLAALEAGAPAPPVPSSTAVPTPPDEHPKTNIQP
jgi:hypothetical protein